MTGAPPRASSVTEVFLVALRLGLTSFGGPVAHLGYFRHEYVERRGWLTDAEYAGTAALCQALPVVCGVTLIEWRRPSWVVVLVAAAGGALLAP